MTTPFVWRSAAAAHPDDPIPAEVPEKLVQAILAARRKSWR